MGMESFNQVPEVPAEPEESERIDDVEKARAMARESKGGHDTAANARKKLASEYIPGMYGETQKEMREQTKRTMDHHEKVADQEEKLAARRVDIMNANPNLGEYEANLQAFIELKDKGELPDMGFVE